MFTWPGITLTGLPCLYLLAIRARLPSLPISDHALCHFPPASTTFAKRCIFLLHDDLFNLQKYSYDIQSFFLVIYQAMFKTKRRVEGPAHHHIPCPCHPTLPCCDYQYRRYHQTHAPLTETGKSWPLAFITARQIPSFEIRSECRSTISHLD